MLKKQLRRIDHDQETTYSRHHGRPKSLIYSIFHNPLQHFYPAFHSHFVYNLSKTLYHVNISILFSRYSPINFAMLISTQNITDLCQIKRFILIWSQKFPLRDEISASREPWQRCPLSKTTTFLCRDKPAKYIFTMRHQCSEYKLRW